MRLSVLLKGTSAWWILLYTGGSFSDTMTARATMPRIHLLFISCHAFHSHTLNLSLFYYFRPLGKQKFAPGTKFLSGKPMYTNSTSCHSLCSWQLHALKPRLLAGPFFFPSSFPHSLTFKQSSTPLMSRDNYCLLRA